MFEIVPKTFWYDFVARRHFWAVVSFATSGLGLFLFLVVGPVWSIDFTGGTEIDMHFEKTTEIAEVRKVLEAVDIPEDAVQQVGDPADSKFTVRIQGSTAAKQEDVDAVKAALVAKHGAAWIEDFRVETEVGARIALTHTGAQLAQKVIETDLARLPGVSVTPGSDGANTFYIGLPGASETINAALVDKLKDRVPKIDRADSVGPKVGGSLRTAGITSLVVSGLLHLVYVAIRFDFTFAPGAIICLVHDVLITVGILVALRQEFGLSTVSALLTLSGYSLNDTIVVYDRIRENLERYKRKNFGDLINDAINQTLSRTIMTSGATSMAMLPFLFIGGPVLKQFALVMLIGIVVGTYSSVYVAAPLTMILREYEPQIRKFMGGGRKSTVEAPKTP